jgi:tetratricopeptide (TPR) repeat protein
MAFGSRVVEAYVLANLALAHQRRGELDRAAELLGQELGIDREGANRIHEGVVLSNLGAVEALRGRSAQALLHLEAAMVRHRETGNRLYVAMTSAQLAQSLTADNVRIQAFYPMTFPLTCGPGSIAAAITVGASLHSRRVTEALVNFAGGLAATLLVGLLVTLTFRYAGRLLRPLGEVGQIVFLRLMAFMLLCVGVQIVWDGASALLQGLGNSK